MLRLENIHVTLGRFHLGPVQLEVNRGEYIVILGPTGTGKTVLLETIAGIHRIDEGRIEVNGVDVTCLPPEKRNLGVVYQDYALFPHLSVYKNIAFGLKLKGTPKKDMARAIEKIAAFLDIERIMERYPERLSGGEKQRVALARALVLEPYVLLLDEPLSSLDRHTRYRLRYELKRIHRELGTTIFHITHDLEEGFFLADRMALMIHGRIVQQGIPREMLRSPANTTSAGLMGISNLVKCRPCNNGRIETPIGILHLPNAHLGASGTKDLFYLMIPDSSIELLPDSFENIYLWEGLMEVEDVNFMGASTEIVLKHDSGERFSTVVTEREIRKSVHFVEIGDKIHVAISTEGVRLVPVG